MLNNIRAERLQWFPNYNRISSAYFIDRTRGDKAHKLRHGIFPVTRVCYNVLLQYPIRLNHKNFIIADLDGLELCCNFIHKTIWPWNAGSRQPASIKPVGATSERCREIDHLSVCAVSSVPNRICYDWILDVYSNFCGICVVPLSVSTEKCSHVLLMVLNFNYNIGYFRMPDAILNGISSFT